MEGPARLLHGFVEPPEDVELPDIDEVPEPGADDGLESPRYRALKERLIVTVRPLVPWRGLDVVGVGHRP